MFRYYRSIHFKKGIRAQALMMTKQYKLRLRRCQDDLANWMSQKEKVNLLQLLQKDDFLVQEVKVWVTTLLSL